MWTDQKQEETVVSHGKDSPSLPTRIWLFDNITLLAPAPAAQELYIISLSRQGALP